MAQIQSNSSSVLPEEPQNDKQIIGKDGRILKSSPRATNIEEDMQYQSSTIQERTVAEKGSYDRANSHKTLHISVTRGQTTAF